MNNKNRLYFTYSLSFLHETHNESNIGNNMLNSNNLEGKENNAKTEYVINPYDHIHLVFNAIKMAHPITVR